MIFWANLCWTVWWVSLCYLKCFSQIFISSQLMNQKNTQPTSPQTPHFLLLISRIGQQQSGNITAQFFVILGLKRVSFPFFYQISVEFIIPQTTIILISFFCSAAKVDDTAAMEINHFIHKSNNFTSLMSLSQDIAEARAAILRKNSINYNYNIVLGTEQYSGLAEMFFYIDNTNFQELYIDFSPTEIQTITVNSINLSIPQNIDNFLIIPRKYLQKGRNYISVLYTNEYDNDGLGCLTFADDNDLQYIYTQFEAYGANRVFPCFDQPDLKAYMKLSVVAPKEWTVISNQPSIKNAFNLTEYKSSARLLSSSSEKLIDLLAKRVGDDTSLTVFETTQLLPTYVLGFSAGKFIFVDPDQPSLVPMTIYAVASVGYQLQDNKEFIFDVLQKAMLFFEDFFGVKYPFKKYDHVFLRELNFGAMQNPGMVTFAQEYLLKEEPTEEDKYNLANVVVHELTHHWFGDYVTMKWWDDLWLNESFAEFMAVYTLSKINNQLNDPLPPAEIYFRDQKYDAYVEDERNTATHPIRGVVQDTTVADSIFDGITYNKGAAVLKQLMFLVRDIGFSNALKKYFSRFAWDNATILDLLDDLADSFPTDLLNITIDDWRKDWLETASLNILESHWDPNSVSNTAELTIYQRPYRQDDSNLRCHAIEVAFFSQSGDKLSSQLVVIDKSSNQTPVVYDASQGVSAVLVNFNDYGYLQNYIDQVSLQWFMANINKISDDLARSCVWYNIGAMARQSLVSVHDFVIMIHVNLFDEPLDFIFDKMLSQLLEFLNSYVTKDEAIRFKTLIFSQIYDELKNGDLTEDDADRVQILYKHYINYAVTDGQKIQINYLLQEQDLTNLTNIIDLDDEFCWEIVKKVFSINSPEFRLIDDQKWAIFEKMQALDKSYRADDARQICGAILATAMQYDQLFNELLIPGLDLYTRQLYAQGLTNEYNEQNYFDNYRQLYFDSLIDPAVYNSLTYYEFRLFYNRMRPFDSDYTEQVKKYKQVLLVLSKVPSMAAHCINISKIVDDLTMSIENNVFNSDSNLTLTKVRADLRQSYIETQSVSYIYNITYTTLQDNNASTYEGLAEITFNLRSLPKLLPIDFVSSEIKNLVVNDSDVFGAPQDEFLIIPRLYLKKGVNHIQVNYVNKFNNDGLGCMGYIDNSSGTPQYYTYTQFEPHSAHRFIPCFDQPNLKATASFNVIVPNGWMAASNNAEKIIGPFVEADYTANAPAHYNSDLLSQYLADKSGTYYILNTTDYLSTYLYCVISGQYYSKIADPIQLHNGIPMTLYSLRSYTDNLQLMGDFIFEVTRLSLDLFESKFGIPYQFKKYDTVFCHQYKFGAMENPGLITFNDSYLYGEAVAVSKLAKFATTIAHECAHNWFGNFVTMSWWDDLWLNESFADFISYYCIQNIKDSVQEFKGLSSAWLGGQVRAVGGYREDQITSTTHPVRSVVPNTGVALKYFDGITYQKGSMILKQLMFLLGQENFFKGLNSYFIKYGFSNATMDNFLAQMSANFKETFTIELWSEMWILTPSLNIITSTWDPASTQKQATLTLNQTNYTNFYDQLRYHKVNVAFFKNDGSYTTQKVLIRDQAQTPVIYDASVGVKAILVNEDHQDFMKYRFDETSQQFFMNNLDLIQNSFTRMIIYFYLNEQIRDGYLRQKIVPYRDGILPLLQTQTEDTVFQYVLQFLNTATSQYLSSDLRLDARTPLFDFVLTSLQSFGEYEAKLQKLRQLRLKEQPKKLMSVIKGRMNKPLCKKNIPRKLVQILTDLINRQLILKDFLPVLCPPALPQVGIMKAWLEGTQPTLISYKIGAAQGWAVVRLIYISPYTLDQKTAALTLHSTKYPGITADLVGKTCLYLNADDQAMKDAYQNIFKTETQSITVKTYIAQGWNNGVHADILVNYFKKKIFADIPDLSKKLSSQHFAFFYTNLQPIDDELETTIDYYNQIKLTGSDLLGDINEIKQIVDELQVRKNLYLINST